MAMAENWMAATKPSNHASILQPFSRFSFPPPMVTRNPTMVASSTTVAKLIRKPVVRHMEQKDRSSPMHSFSVGKSRHSGSATVLQLLCRPMLRETVWPVAAVTLYDTQSGITIDASVIAVA